MNQQSIKKILIATCHLLFFTILLPIQSTVFAAEVKKNCNQINSFQASNISAGGADFNWTGNINGLTMGLTVTVNGVVNYSGPVVGYNKTVYFLSALIDGDVVNAILDYKCASGTFGVMQDQFVFRIVATSQPVLKNGQCAFPCTYTQFCKQDVITYGLTSIKNLSNYYFESKQLCACVNNHSNLPINDALETCLTLFIKKGWYGVTNSCDDPNDLPACSQSNDIDGNRMNLSDQQIAEVEVFPNPFEGSFTLSFDQEPEGLVYFQLVDVRGQVVLEQLLEGKREFILDTNQLPTGVYWYKFYLNGNYYSNKIMKM